MFTNHFKTPHFSRHCVCVICNVCKSSVGSHLDIKVSSLIKDYLEKTRARNSKIGQYRNFLKLNDRSHQSKHLIIRDKNE